MDGALVGNSTTFTMLIIVHFGQYGEIESITLKTDMATGRSRGFCFIVYKTTDGLDKAVAQSEHNIQNKKVAVKKAQAKQGKVYIGKLPADLSDDDIKNHMATFGTIANIEQPFDKVHIDLILTYYFKGSTCTES